MIRSGPGPLSEHLCECGCGERTRLVLETHRRQGHVRGQPHRFCLGHQCRADGTPGRSPKPNSSGYTLIYLPEHPKSVAGYVREHVVMVEAVLGRPLPPKAEVHHINEDKADNRNANFVLCQDHSYHFLLHQRLRALRACGNADWRKCWICRTYDDPSSLYHGPRPGSGWYHRACRNARGIRGTAA